MKLPNNEMFESMSAAQTNWMTSMTKLGEIAASGQRQMMAQHMKVLETCQNVATRQSELLKDVSEPTEYFAKATEVASDFGRDMAAVARESLEMQMELGGEMARAFQAQEASENA